MNVKLDLSKGQLSKLRNGHSIRVSPAMVGSGVDLIIDPTTYHNIEKHMKKGKGTVIKMGSNDIEQNKMEGTGLFAGAGNKSGKISRFKKGTRWRDFANDTARMGIDTAKYASDQYKEAKNPVSSQMKKMLGGEMEGSGNKSGKISRYKKGTRWRDFANDTLRMGIDTAKYGSDKYKEAKNPVSSQMKKMLGGGKKMTRFPREMNKNPPPDYDVIRPAVMPRDRERPNRSSFKGKTLPSKMELFGEGLRLSGDGLRMSGGRCCMCGAGNDKFIFSDVAL